MCTRNMMDFFPRRLLQPLLLALMLAMALHAASASAATIASYNFIQGPQEWQGNAAVGDLHYTSEGMTYTAIAEDSYVYSPPADYPTSAPARIVFRMRSTASPSGQIYYGSPISAEKYVLFAIANDGQWHDYRVELPPLGSGARVRIDTNEPVSGHTNQVAIAWVQTQAAMSSSTVVLWDFKTGLNGWTALNQVANSRLTADGWAFDSTGVDPYVGGPAVDYPAGTALRVTIRMRLNAGESGQLFWSSGGFTEAQAAHFGTLRDGAFHDYELILPPLGKGYQFRLDPATQAGAVTIDSIRVVTIPPIDAPILAPPSHPQSAGAAPLQINSGSLQLQHFGRHWGGYVLRIGGIEMASGQEADLLGFLENNFATFLSVRDAAATCTVLGGQLTEQVTLSDSGGAHWTLTRRFSPGARPGTISVRVQIQSDKARSVVHFPWITLFPGLDTFETSKTQGLLAGLEYLDVDEPSSSQKDVIGSAAIRLVPSPYKITFPLMAINHQGRTLGLMWELSDKVAAIHDSPDRVYHSNAHLMALWAPGVGPLRRENSLFGDAPFTIAPGVPVVANLTLSGDLGNNIVPAIQAYVGVYGLPPLPSFPGGLDGAIEMLAKGYTQSGIYDNNGKWQHAVNWSGTMTAAPDAVVFCRWLAARAHNSATVADLTTAAALGQQRLDEASSSYSGGIAHDSWPMTNLVLGKLPAYLDGSALRGKISLSSFDPNGVRHFVPPVGKENLDDTHFADHANGYSATALQGALVNALLSYDASLVTQTIHVLDQQTALYANSAPRGAQTWEVPLHTPDIMASAYMCKAYVYGYELTSRQDLLDQAKYWAWTGVPFVYLKRSFPGAVGEYATPPVFGATIYTSPVWIGLPVQWCGLVYRNALTRLAQYDTTGPWKRLADGITLSGLQQSWPAGLDLKLQGTLPDSFNLLTQGRQGPYINPGTVLMSMPEAFGAGALYGFRRAAGVDWLIHAPSVLKSFTVSSNGVRFQTDGWGAQPYSIFLANVKSVPAQIIVRHPGDAYVPPAYQYDAARGRLIISNLIGDMEFVITKTNGADGWVAYR